MRLKLLNAVLIIACVLNKYANAQNCVPTGLNHSTVTSTCDQVCRDLTFQVPDLRSTSDYTIITIPYQPYTYNPVTATHDDLLYQDDAYSNIFNLPFPFCFYDQVYTQAVICSNGFVTFDYQRKNDCPNATEAPYIVRDRIFYTGGPVGCSSDNYPVNSIMGAFMDLDPSINTGVFSNRKIEWRVEGTAPCRRFVVSFVDIASFGNSGCGSSGGPTTFQIVMTESTGVIDVFIKNKQCEAIYAPNPYSANAILGIQGTTATQAVAAPQKNARPWTAFEEGYRFVPTGGTSRFVSAELLQLDHTPIATATSTNTTPGLLDLNFTNICSPALTTDYVLRTRFASCSDPGTFLEAYDTITINRSTVGNFNPTITPTATSCATASNGSVLIEPTSGVSPYTFMLTPGGTVLTGATANFTGLAAGSYSVSITDASGCVNPPISFTIAPGGALTTTVNKTDVLCNGGNTGTITVTPFAGSAPIEYSLDGVTWQSSNVFNGLIAGTYTAYYREGSGCQNSQSVTISEPTALSATAATVPVICNGQSNGTITITSAGGVAPYEYSIDGGANWQSSNTFNVAANTYTITIRDINGCTTTRTVTVTEPAVLTASSTNSPASCDGGNDGVITVTANGGNSIYQYSIDGTNFQASNTFNVAPGNYTVTVKDNLGCTTSFPAIVTLNNNLIFTPQTDATICEGKSVQLSLTSNATEYLWTPATGLSSTTIYNPLASPTVTTQYTVTATLGRCSADDIVTVNVYAAPIPNAGVDGFICYGQTYQLQASGGTQYSWSPATYLDDATSANPISTPTKDMTYTLSIVTDVNGCASLVTDEVKIDVTPPIKVKTVPFDTLAYSNDQFMIKAFPSDPDVISYTWTPTIGLSDPNIADPIVTAGAIGEVTQYRVVASTLAGCKGEGFVTVRVYKGPDIYVPTGFTPNSDGKNDRFIPVPVGVKSFKYFRVFNRWGQMLFSTSNMNEGWDGKFQGRDQPTGTYVWMIEGYTKDGHPITKKGVVTLIR